MPQNLSPQSSLPPLSVGNVVSAGIRLYRSHFKQYLGLSFKALLWWLIPVYGWAKAATIIAMISRQGFCELINQPESVGTTRGHLNPKLWSFLLTQILRILIDIGISISLGIVSSFLMIIPAILITVFVKDSFVGISISTLLQTLINLITLGLQLWFQARFFVAELPLAIENNVESTTTIVRSWQLTKGLTLKIQMVLLVAYLITIPLVSIAFLPLFFMIPLLSSRITQDTVTSIIVLLGLLCLILLSITNVLIRPFWQAIKAVIYYDLRSRKEGLGLQLRDRPI